MTASSSREQGMEDPRVEAAAKALKTGKGWSYPFALKLATSALAAADAVTPPRDTEREIDDIYVDQAEDALAKLLGRNALLEDALRSLSDPIDEALRTLDPDKGAGYIKYRVAWDGLRHTYDKACRVLEGGRNTDTTKAAEA